MLRRLAIDEEMFRFLNRYGKIERGVETRLEGLDDLVDDNLRCGSTGREADGADIADFIPVDFRGPLHQHGALGAGAQRHFHQPLGIGGIGRTDDNEEVAAGAACFTAS